MSLSSKSTVRGKYREIRKSLTAEIKQQLDERITENFLKLDEYKNCKMLLVFISKDIEVDTANIINKAFADDKIVLAPRCDSEANTMSFYVIGSRNDLKRGYFDILEPNDSCEKLSDFENAVCLVPGLAYDKRGYRTGFGGGYYDRFLSSNNVISVGLCYSDCVADELPVDEHDCPVNILVTDNKTFRKD